MEAIPVNIFYAKIVSDLTCSLKHFLGERAPRPPRLELPYRIISLTTLKSSWGSMPSDPPRLELP